MQGACFAVAAHLISMTANQDARISSEHEALTETSANVSRSRHSGSGGPTWLLSLRRRRPSAFLTPSSRKEWPRPLRITWYVGVGVLVVGFFVLAYWSELLASRSELTFDYSFYGQMWYLIAHGHLNPMTTIAGGSFPAWKNASELILWPLAVFWYLWPHPQTLLWIQDIATAGCELVLFTWCCELVDRRAAATEARRWIYASPLIALVLLVALPWIPFIDSFDFHPEAIILFFALLAARGLWLGRRSAWLWIVVTLLGGSLGATYVAGIGISSLFIRGRRFVGIGLAMLGALAIFVLAEIGADGAGIGAFTGYTVIGTHEHIMRNNVSAFGIVSHLVAHPEMVIRQARNNWVDLYADIFSGGGIGLITPIGFGIPLLATLENLLGGNLFIAPTTQNNFPTILLVAFGSALVCIYLLSALRKKHQRAGMLLVALLVANGIGWSATWLPRLKSQWLRGAAVTATVLTQVKNQISASDEVIVSEGVVGSFSFRQWVYPVVSPGTWPVHSRVVWFVFTPMYGIEFEAPSEALGEVAYLDNVLHARLVLARGGVYAFRWTPPAGTRSVTLPAAVNIPGSELSGTAAGVVSKDAISNGHASANGAEGYVVSNDYWRVGSGSFVASARVRSSGPINVELWNDTANTLIERRTVSTHERWATVNLPFIVAQPTPTAIYSGFWPFRIVPVGAPLGEVIEVRVWSPGREHVVVSNISLASSHSTALRH